MIYNIIDVKYRVLLNIANYIIKFIYKNNSQIIKIAFSIYKIDVS